MEGTWEVREEVRVGGGKEVSLRVGTVGVGGWWRVCDEMGWDGMAACFGDSSRERMGCWRIDNEYWTP